MGHRRLVIRRGAVANGNAIDTTPTCLRQSRRFGPLAEMALKTRLRQILAR
jgi:hypothetical protein